MDGTLKPVSEGKQSAGVGLDQQSKQQRGSHASSQGSQGIEDGDGKGSQFQWKYFAHGEIGGTCCGRGDKEDDGEANAKAFGIQMARGERQSCAGQ